MAHLIYLRKSRADQEAEMRGEGETLSRHKALLLDLAKRMDLVVGDIYEEIVSGETIASRPQMQRLLSEVEAGQWEGVLVAEVERLARGSSIDQGIVAQAFQYSNTKIITPAKTYDPANEFDAEYFEFGLFMSRREYTTIKRRMEAGRIASVKEGKYLGKTAPYGYIRQKLTRDKGYTLAPHPEQSKIVQDMFAWYLEGLGYQRIARRLNAMGLRTNTGHEWTEHNMKYILQNPIYCGYVTWGRRPLMKSVTQGRIQTNRPVADSYLKVKGIHPPLISEETFDAVQRRIKLHPAIPISHSKTLMNPFQGLLYCAQCGYRMQLHVYKRPSGEFYSMACRHLTCNTVSSRVPQIEAVLLQALRQWLDGRRVLVTQDATDPFAAELSDLESALQTLQSELKQTEAQLQRAFELVEQDVYSTEQFLARQRSLGDRQSALHQRQTEINSRIQQIKMQQQTQLEIIPRVAHIIDAYPRAASAQEKNELLRSILSKILYTKTAPSSQKKLDSDITLYLYPLIPGG